MNNDNGDSGKKDGAKAVNTTLPSSASPSSPGDAYINSIDGHSFPPRKALSVPQYEHHTMPSDEAKQRRGIVVVKIGTSSLMREATTDDSHTVSSTAGRMLPAGCGELAISTLALLVDTLLALRRDGYRVVLVTSGAVGVGCRELNVERRPKLSASSTPEERKRILARLQAYAAVGQSVLMQTYDRFMRMAHQPIAQVLLTSTDLDNETAYANAKATIHELLDLGIIPIINENDTVATEEIKYGDNDWLSALVSTVIGAEWLFLLTDVDMLYTDNPRNNSDAKPIRIVQDINTLDIDVSSKSSGTQWGVGGMNTKITAARLATAAGVRVGLLHGRHPHRVLSFVNHYSDNSNSNSNITTEGTVFMPALNPMRGVRRKWISHCLPPKGDIYISGKGGAELHNGHPLRCMHVLKVEGCFPNNSAVRIHLCEYEHGSSNSNSKEIARGLCRHGSNQVAEFAGKNRTQISIGEPIDDVIVAAKDLAVLARDNSNSE